MRMATTKELDHCIDVLELPRSVVNLLDAHSQEELRKGLEQFKAVARSHRRKLAKKYHPDVTGGDKNRMMAINNAMDFVMSLCMIERRPARHVVYYWGASASMNATTTASMNFEADFNFENIKRFFEDVG